MQRLDLENPSSAFHTGHRGLRSDAGGGIPLLPVRPDLLWVRDAAAPGRPALRSVPGSLARGLAGAVSQDAKECVFPRERPGADRKSLEIESLFYIGRSGRGVR